MLLELVAALLPRLQDLPNGRPDELRVALVPAAPDEAGAPRWSPKAASVALTGTSVLSGSFTLGDARAKAIAVRLERSEGAVAFDVLHVDRDRDGAFGEGERLTATPSEQRGKWWSSFATELEIPVLDEDGSVRSCRPYPVALWFVADPREPTAEPALRWSRRGWHVGTCEIDGAPAWVMVTERVLDGVFDQRDSFALARDRAALARADARTLEQHAWLDGRAYRPLAIDGHGRWLTLARIDPGITEAEEKDRADLRKADRAAPRAAQPLAFGKDLGTALASARSDGRRVLLDFTTSWCGPCKEMAALVYSAAPVVDAAAGVIAVEIDGDESRELVKRYGVQGYPTLILLDGSGREIRRAVGYQGVAAMVEFFRR